MEEFDLIVLGGGTAGFAAARRGRAHGARVAMVEEAVLGGECPNTGCVPTKAMLRSAEAFEAVRRAGEFGIRSGDPRADWPTIRERTRRIVLGSGTDAETEARLKDEGITVMRGHGVFTGERAIEVAGRRLTAGRIILTAGVEDRVPPIPGLAEAGFLTHKEAFDIESLPGSMAIIGAGPVGVEFAQIFAPFGVRVTLLAAEPLPLGREDAEISRWVLTGLQESGIEVETGVRVASVERRNGKKVVEIRREATTKTIPVDEIFLAAGHTPAVASLGLEAAGIAATRRGIQVDEFLRTTAPGIWAAGDVTGIAQFTHVANYQGKLAGNNAFADTPQAADHRVVPRATFCRPEVGSVGLTERELVAAGAEFRSASVPIANLEKSIVTGERQGVARLLADPEGQILGGHVVGVRAGELVHEVAVAMRNRVPVSGIAQTIHAFPNFSEIWEAVARRLA